jgi:hypothetical protein
VIPSFFVEEDQVKLIEFGAERVSEQLERLLCPRTETFGTVTMLGWKVGGDHAPLERVKPKGVDALEERKVFLGSITRILGNGCRRKRKGDEKDSGEEADGVHGSRGLL